MSIAARIHIRSSGRAALPLHALCLCLLCFVSVSSAAERLPDTPGVYQSGDGRLIVVGAGKITSQLRGDRAERLALALAGRDARARLARYLFPQETRSGSVFVSLSGSVVLHQGPMPADAEKMLVVLAVDPAKVSLAAYEPLQEHYEVRIAPFFSDILREDPSLAEGGGRILARDGGWLAIGVGYATLSPEADRAGERAARTIARVHAEKAIAAAVFGAEVTLTESQLEIVAEGPGGAALKEWAATRFAEEVRGTLAHTLSAGEWRTLDGRLGLAMVTGCPEPVSALYGTPGILDAPEGNASGATPDGKSAEAIPPRFVVEEAWQQPLLSRPWLLQGGLALHEQDQALWLLVVEGRPLSGNPAEDRLQLPLLAQTQARNAAARFLSGATITSGETESEQRLFDSVGNKDETVLTLSEIAREDVSGVVDGMKTIGSWISTDRNIAYFAYVLRCR